MITPDHIADVNERLKVSHYSGIPCTVSPDEYWDIASPKFQRLKDECDKPEPYVDSELVWSDDFSTLTTRKRSPRAAHYHCAPCPVNVKSVCDLPCDRASIDVTTVAAVIKEDFDAAQRKQDYIDEWLKG
jgi:hypothetical protein